VGGLVGGGGGGNSLALPFPQTNSDISYNLGDVRHPPRAEYFNPQSHARNHL